MAMAVGKKSAGGGRRSRRGGSKHAPMSEINVTPMVDVMLVLLIIFMVAAPLLTVGVPIDLPETEAKQLNVETQPISISVNAQGQVFLQETEVGVDEIVSKLQAIATTGYEERIFIRADANTDYGTVMKVMGRISNAGYKNIGLVTQQEQGN
ncbi:protein TolR [Rhizobium sp. L1K21]|uniref:protein TolR n=1 Tax=Rhizobium sp. L1K21 TaxID=2954933 RepID=UPI002093F6E4|nr:protein TolR [Rhizobium sp. L1K21]MCO6185103.1 protein TolR [Rhizobium sp. L1K21]